MNPSFHQMHLQGMLRIRNSELNQVVGPQLRPYTYAGAAAHTLRGLGRTNVSILELAPKRQCPIIKSSELRQ